LACVNNRQTAAFNQKEKSFSYLFGYGWDSWRFCRESFFMLMQKAALREGGALLWSVVVWSIL
jgi:hypothetical protein